MITMTGTPRLNVPIVTVRGRYLVLLNNDDVETARRTLRERAHWASRHGFFYLTERDMQMVERLGISPHLTDADNRHLQSVLMRLGGAEYMALLRRLPHV